MALPLAQIFRFCQMKADITHEWWHPSRHADRRPLLLARNRIQAGIRGWLAEEGFTEVDPAAIPSGTAMVQLGAFDDQDTARGEWQRLSAKFGDLMAGKSLVVQAAQSGGRPFSRLRAMGFASEEDSRLFCTAMLKGNATCIPVLQR